MDREGQQAVQFDGKLGVSGRQLGEPSASVSVLSGQTADTSESGVLIPVLALLVALAVVWFAVRAARARLMRGLHAPSSRDREPEVPESVLRFVQVLLADSGHVSSFLALLDAEPIRRQEILKSCLAFLDSVPAAQREEITSFLQEESNFLALAVILKRQMQSNGQRAVV